LGGDATLTSLSDFKGDDLVQRVLGLVDIHEPLHVSLVGGEPLMRHRELSRILPALAAQGRYVLVVTSAVIPIPQEWMQIAHLTIAVSIDGLPEHHNPRREPATYDRILRNIEGRRVNIHGTLTRPMLRDAEYLEEYVRFWSERPEVQQIWISLYSPQVGEQSPEMLLPEDRRHAQEWLTALNKRYKKLLVPDGMAAAYLDPPKSPAACVFARMSANYTADLVSRVEPCVFGGNPDCSQCGCSASIALRWIEDVKVGPLRVRHLVNGSMRVGKTLRRLRGRELPKRWAEAGVPADELVQIR
jgi:sulfatase maturation enzyme AslB (radical SAM superfamily)